MKRRYHAFVYTIGLAVVSVMLCQGCAFGHRAVALSYTPSVTAQSEGAGQKVHVAAIRDIIPTHEVTVLARDGTPFKTETGKEIGEVRNGFHMKTACVASMAKDLGPWVTDALVKELKQRGFAPVAVTDLPPNTSLGVSGSLSECYSKILFFKGQQCTIKATILIHQNGAVVSSTTYVGHTTGGLAFYTSREYEKIFQLALADLLGKVVRDIGAKAQ